MPIQNPVDIYLDANATTRVLPQAAQDAKAAMEELFGNPSSSHITGIRARHLLETTRDLIKSVLGAKTGRIIFTSGATEAIQIAVFSTLCRVREEQSGDSSKPGLLLYGATEHKAVPQALTHWNRTLGLDADVVKIPVDPNGKLDLDFLSEHAASANIVCTMAVNNETGVIHDLAAIEHALRSRNESVMWLVDCVQAIGKTKLDLSSTTIDFALASGHKLHAPKGIGVLYVREGSPLTPLFAGGGQESGARSGTENLPGVAALAAVFRCLDDTDDPTFKSLDVLKSYRDRIAASLKRAFPSIVFNTPFDHAVPTTINFSVKGFTSKEILDLFDAAGIRVSSGSACGSALQGSYVLDAMGLPQWRSEGAIRVSFGLSADESEIAAACRRIEEAGKALCDACLIETGDAAKDTKGIEGLVQLKSGSNCSWILADPSTRRCIIVDPFKELADRIETLVRCQKCKVLAILDTHQHVDHDSYRDVLLERLSSQLAEGARTSDPLGWPADPDGQIRLGDGSEAPFIRLSASEVIARTKLPGHTIDGRAYLVGCLTDDNEMVPDDVRFAFTGDTILIGGIGRTDFPSSSAPDLYESLRRLPRLIGTHTTICPTHDYVNGFSTTLGVERRNSEFLTRVLDDVAPLPLKEFLNEKSRIDSEIDDQCNAELICGRIDSNPKLDTSVDIPPDELKEFFQRHRDSLIVDVRESQEYRFFQNWDALGLEVQPQNVPLTRFSDFLQGLLKDERPASSRDIIFVCRSGNRSGKAAEALRRMGMKNVWHIAGGIALGTRPNGVSADALDLEYFI